MSICVYRKLSQKQLPNYAIRGEYRKGKTSVHLTNQPYLSKNNAVLISFLIASMRVPKLNCFVFVLTVRKHPAHKN